MTEINETFEADAAPSNSPRMVLISGHARPAARFRRRARVRADGAGCRRVRNRFRHLPHPYM